MSDTYRDERLANAPPALAQLLKTRAKTYEEHRQRVALAKGLAAQVPIYIECTVVNPNPLRSSAERVDYIVSLMRNWSEGWNCTNAALRDPPALIRRGHVEYAGRSFADACTDVRLGFASDQLEESDLMVPFGSRPVFSERWIRIHFA